MAMDALAVPFFETRVPPFELELPSAAIGTASPFYRLGLTPLKKFSIRTSLVLSSLPLRSCHFFSFPRSRGLRLAGSSYDFNLSFLAPLSYQMFTMSGLPPPTLFCHSLCDPAGGIPSSGWDFAGTVLALPSLPGW